MAKTIVVIEDDRDIAGLIELHLRDMGCGIRLCHDGRTGLKTVLEDPPDLVILDLMIPEIDGLEVCRRLRSEAPYTPILMLTAKSTELDRVVGLEMGADDYLTKPFSIREL
ncbi:MAG TPA: response regulator, partial [Nitrospiria bacterium]